MSINRELFLIPNEIAENTAKAFLTNHHIEIISSIKNWIAESEKGAARFLGKHLKIDASKLVILEMSKKGDWSEIEKLIKNLPENESIGIISDAGLPCVADPGHKAVLLAHKYNYRLEALVGPSSLMQALSASGLQGNSFVFHGYLPIESKQLESSIRNMVQHNRNSGYTQLFIEAPQRSLKMFELLKMSLPAEFSLSVSCNLMALNGFTKSHKISQWRILELPEIDKKPCIFVFGNHE